jgi:HPr kinase/phosphorylase
MHLSIRARDVAERLGFKRMNPGFEDERVLEGSAVFFAGLAMAGYLEHVRPHRMILIGESELGYLEGLGEEKARANVVRVLDLELGCVLATSDRWVPQYLVEEATQRRVAIYYSRDISPQALQPRVSEFLRDQLAPRETIHGVMMDISGVGVLLQGPSGIGKSECALELIKRGHRLVADDAVLLKRLTDQMVVAEPPEGLKHAMELRGIGLVDVRALFGMGAISERKEVDLVVRLEKWDPAVSYERLGVDQKSCEVAGVERPYVVIPVIEAKNLSILIEVAAMNQHLRNLGIHSARLLTDALEARLAEKAARLAEASEQKSS